MNIKHTTQTPILTVDNKWEVTIEESEASTIDREDMLQTATYAFYVDKITKLNNGKYLLKLTPRS